MDDGSQIASEHAKTSKKGSIKQSTTKAKPFTGHERKTDQVNAKLRACDNRWMFVETSGSQKKPQCCIFCKKTVIKLPRHFETVHQNELEVKKVSSLPKGNIQSPFFLILCSCILRLVYTAKNSNLGTENNNNNESTFFIKFLKDFTMQVF